MQVEQRHLVRQFAAIEHGFLRDGDAEVVAQRIDRRGAHAAARGCAGEDDRIRPHVGQVAHQRRPEEGRRLALLDENVARLRRDFGDDLVSLVADNVDFLVRARTLQPPDAEIETVRPPRIGGVDHRQPLGARHSQNLLRRVDAIPGAFAAGEMPALDRFKNRLAAVTAEVVIHVDDHDRWSRAVTGALSPARRFENFAVALAQHIVPNRPC